MSAECRLVFALLFSTLCSACGDSDESVRAVGTVLQAISFNHRLAERWAPIHYQDVDGDGTHSLGGKSDFITAINYDGDWNTRNNWENLPHYPAAAHCYFSVVNTKTHWYIIYAFYHPRDWSDSLFGFEHENDLEGLLAIVRRPDRPDLNDFGELEGIVTVFHNDFFSFVPTGSPLSSGLEDVDGTLRTERFQGDLHPVTAQEAEGHGLKAFPYVDIKGSNWVKYYPSLQDAEVPDGTTDRHVLYKLVDVFDPGNLWDRRDFAQTFEEFGVFNGDNGSGSAHAPWEWDDQDDGFFAAPGILAYDPAILTTLYFDGTGAGNQAVFSTDYETNRYLEHFELCCR